jgi:hypothetical protein
MFPHTSTSHARNVIVSLTTKKALLVGAMVKSEAQFSLQYLAQNFKTFITDYIRELSFLADTIAISSDPQMQHLGESGNEIHILQRLAR